MTRAQSGGPLRITHPGVLPPARVHPSPGESKGRSRGPGDQPSFPGPPPPPVSCGRGCRHGNAPLQGQRGSLAPGAGPDVSLGLSRRSGQFTAAGAARADCGAGQAEAGPAPPAPHRPFPAASTAAAGTTSPQHSDSAPRTRTPADVTDGRARWPTAEPAAGPLDQWAARRRGFFSPNALPPADMRAKLCQDGGAPGRPCGTCSFEVART